MQPLVCINLLWCHQHLNERHKNRDTHQFKNTANEYGKEEKHHRDLFFPCQNISHFFEHVLVSSAVFLNNRRLVHEHQSDNYMMSVLFNLSFKLSAHGAGGRRRCLMRMQNVRSSDLHAV